jgi:hypothetical protein
VREDGRIVGGEGWQEKVRNGEEWKKLLRTARNRQILHISMEWMNENRQKEMLLLAEILLCCCQRLSNKQTAVKHNNANT